MYHCFLTCTIKCVLIDDCKGWLHILPHLQCITNIETEQCVTQRGKGWKHDNLKEENYCSSEYEREESASDEEDERATKKLGQHLSAKNKEKVHVHVGCSCWSFTEGQI